MIRNYLTTAFRNAARRPVNTGINILGLAIGVACCLVIGLYVSDEYSYDSFHPDADRLYRVEQTISDGSHRWSVTSIYHGPAIEDMLPEVVETARLFSRNYVIGTDALRFDGQTVGFADPALMDLFGFEVVHGTGDLLGEPENIVLMQPLAERLFDSENPVGQSVLLDNEHEFTVSGVVALPDNTHLGGVEAFVSFGIILDFYGWLEDNPGASTTQTYALLAPGAVAADVEARLPAVSKRVRGEADAEQLHMKAVTELRLNPETTGSTGTQGTVDLFIAIALLVLLIACVNYVNLATAGGTERLREVGMRKAFGAHRRQLIGQFIGESTIQAVFSVLLAVLLVELALPLVNDVTDKSLEIGLFEHLPGMGALAVLALIVGTLAGAYPALYLSRFRPVAILKGKGGDRTGSPLLRRSLVVVQFVASITLISGTLAIQDQLSFLQESDLGFNSEQVMTIAGQSAGDAQLDEFVRQIGQVPAIESISRGTIAPGNHGWQSSMTPSGVHDDEQSISHLFVPAGPDLLRTLDMTLVAGRNFDPERAADDRRALIVNETSARMLGYREPADAIGQQYDVNYIDEGEIVGVVKDFHLNSLRNEIGPLVFVHQNEGTVMMAVRLSTDDLPGTLASIEERWSTVLPEWPFSYRFLDNTFDALYRSERRSARLFTWFAGLAMMVACLGLFGLASLVTRQRTREVGIRKVLGASIGSIFTMLTGGFIVLIGVAFLIAAPVTWILMNRWLSGFAYHIEFPASSLVVAGTVTLLLSVLVVGVRAVRTAVADPVASLRYE